MCSGFLQRRSLGVVYLNQNGLVSVKHKVLEETECKKCQMSRRTGKRSLRIELLRYLITMGSVTISLIYMGNLFVINKIFTCGNICANDENFTNFNFTTKIFDDTTRINTCIPQRLS